jgi:hypothetical protein
MQHYDVIGLSAIVVGQQQNDVCLYNKKCDVLSVQPVFSAAPFYIGDLKNAIVCVFAEKGLKRLHTIINISAACKDNCLVKLCVTYRNNQYYLWAVTDGNSPVAFPISALS